MGVDELAIPGWTGGFVERMRTASLSDEEESDEDLVSEEDDEEDADEEEDDELDELDESESESELESLSLSVVDAALVTIFTVFPSEGGTGADTGTTGANGRAGVTTIDFTGAAMDVGRMTGVVDLVDRETFSLLFFLAFPTSCPGSFAVPSFFSARFLSRLDSFSIFLEGSTATGADVGLRFFVERSGDCVSVDVQLLERRLLWV